MREVILVDKNKAICVFWKKPYVCSIHFTDLDRIVFTSLNQTSELIPDSNVYEIPITNEDSEKIESSYGRFGIFITDITHPIFQLF